MSVFTVQKRVAGGAKPSQLRRQGSLPMAFIERTHETMMIQAPIDALRTAMRQADGLGRLELTIEGETKPRKAIVRDIAQDPLRHTLLHVTLLEVGEDDQVKVDIPVVGIGMPEGSDAADSTLMQVTDHIKVRGKMSDLPEKIEVDVSELTPGHHIQVSDLKLPEGVELISSPDATVFSYKIRSQTEDLEVSETPTEAEVSGNSEPA